ncbi:hypothetical protein FGO68_gene8123 [Halteria grandinella]|uniref:Uncharacterized protein n=1 Tax=Halteria grandinella TaxID=5974 RepID=A0A8J8SUQ6_HALGN|nr:hypothetical protein FGO68_gene8123 [Halteria grandinella]
MTHHQRVKKKLIQLFQQHCLFFAMDVSLQKPRAFQAQKEAVKPAAYPLKKERLHYILFSGPKIQPQDFLQGLLPHICWQRQKCEKAFLFLPLRSCIKQQNHYRIFQDSEAVFVYISQRPEH